MLGLITDRYIGINMDNMGSACLHILGVQKSDFCDMSHRTELTHAYFHGIFPVSRNVTYMHLSMSRAPSPCLLDNPMF